MDPSGLKCLFKFTLVLGVACNFKLSLDNLDVILWDSKWYLTLFFFFCRGITGGPVMLSFLLSPADMALEKVRYRHHCLVVVAT